MDVVIVVGIMLVGMLAGFIYLRKEMIKHWSEPKTPAQQLLPQITTINMQPLEEAIRSLPNKVLQSIQSSANTKKGALGELVGYTRLQAEYDRIIPLGNIVDFMCIKFPSDSRKGKDPEGVIEMGRVDFVDIKTGKSSRLSKDQRELQKLIKDKRVNFVKMKVETQTSENESSRD
jgi:hypothetical protein